MKFRTVPVLVLVASALTACSSGSSSDVKADAPAKPCKASTLNYIGLEGEDGKVELEAWRNERNIKLSSSWPGDFSQQIAAIKVGQNFDLATIPYHQAQRMIAAKVVRPIDTSRLKNWDSVVPGLRENPALKGKDGKIYAIPIAWGDGPFIYNPETVASPPESILDLADPAWKGRFVLLDSPDLTFAFSAIGAGHDPQHMTPTELKSVVELVRPIVKNAAAFNSSYQDANDRLVAGDVDLAVAGWEAQISWAQEKGVTLKHGFFTETKAGWWDGLAIPATAKNIDCAYEYIDQMIAPETQAKVATNLLSGTVNAEAIDKVGKEAQLYDYSLVTETDDMASFAGVVPSEESEKGEVTYQDWLDAWQDVKAK